MMNKKRLLALLLAVVMVIGMVPTVWATDGETDVEPVACAECGQTEGHLETCSQYNAPAEETGPQVGDMIWIKSGSKVYKKYTNTSNGNHTLWGNYEVKIVNIFTNEADGTAWYEFEFTALGFGELFLSNNGYKYVLVENTSVEDPDEVPDEEEEQEPVDEHACNCGENAPENLADHNDACPRKQYVKSLFEEKTAEEIYAAWETYDEATQNDLLNVLQKWDDTKYEELKHLVDKTPVEDFPGVELEGVSVGIDVEEGVFPAGTTAQVSNVEDASSEVNASKNILAGYYSDSTVTVRYSKVVDISFVHEGEEVQPNGSVYVTFDIPAAEVVASANSLAVFHIADNGSAELMAVSSLDGTGDVSVTVEATHFSHFVVLQSETRYTPTLMRDKLAGNTRYSIVEFPVTLNDFDAEAYNNQYGGEKINDIHVNFSFTKGEGGTGMNRGSLAATQGIVDSELSDSGYPVMTKCADRGSIIFSGNAATGKTVHTNVPFEFIYDNQTGYYTYNSGANHAQYNSSTNKVELYADTLAPFNYRTDLLNKITASGEGNSTKTPTSNGNVKITVNNQTSKLMFQITDNDFKDEYTNQYTHMYLRLNANCDGEIKCKVFYKDENGNKITDTAEANDTYPLAVQKGQWADYVFGPFDSNKKAYEVRFYVPSAVSGNTIEIDTAGLLQTDNTDQVNYAGLYPFKTDLTKSYAGSENFNMTTWENLIREGKNHQLFSSRVMYDKPFEGNELSDEYAYFAMAMEVNFYIPKDGQVNGEDIIFKFNGDDDMWVFVDGNLALDIGGAHTAVAGWINFTTGETEVAKARDRDKSAVTSNKQGRLNANQYTDGEYHTMKIFYMERAGTNSNCLIKFNLPVVPTGNVVVDKQVEVEGGLTPPEDMSFTFKAEVDGTAHANKNYTVTTKDAAGNVTNQTTATTDAQGRFSLKHNQTAYFDGIAENKTVTITEIDPADLGNYKYVSTTVNGTNGTSAEKPTTANGASTFMFVNKYKAFADLVITKQGIDSLDHHLATTTEKNETQSTIYTVTGTSFTRETVGPIKVVIVGNDSVTLKNLPCGNYTVTEDLNWAWRYKLTGITAAQDESATGTPDSGTIAFVLNPVGETITYTNKREKTQWLSGDSWCKNLWTSTGFTEQKVPDED